MDGVQEITSGMEVTVARDINTLTARISFSQPDTLVIFEDLLEIGSCLSGHTCRLFPLVPGGSHLLSLQHLFAS